MESRMAGAQHEEMIISEMYSAAVGAATNKLAKYGYKARYAAYIAASEAVADYKADNGLAPYTNQKSEVHKAFISEAVLCAEMRGTHNLDECVEPTDVIVMPPEFFQRILPSIRGALARKAFAWAWALDVFTGRCLFSDMELAKALRCPLKDAMAVIAKLVKAKLLTPVGEFEGKTNYVVRRDLETNWDYTAHFGETSPSGETFFPMRLSDIVYDFDGAYWISFGTAYEAPSEFLAVLSRKEREEVRQLTERLSNERDTRFFDEDLRETTHLTSHGEIDSGLGLEELPRKDVTLEKDENGETNVVFSPASSAYFDSVNPVNHLIPIPVHGRNNRFRTVKRLRMRTPVPDW